MITSIASAANYLRPAQTSPSRMALTRADALPEAGADQSTAAEIAKYRVSVSDVRKLDTSGLKIISIRDNPELRDRMAASWLQMHAAPSSTDVPDNAPQNTYATVKVNGKVVAPLYNGGSVAMTNEAAAKVGDLQDPPGLTGGPDLAQRRAERIAKATGGTIEKASTAITQSAWKPRQTTSTNYTRAQLDAAFEAMMTEGQRAAAQRRPGYSAMPETSGLHTNFNV
jgi:hypothetical protein